MSYMITLNN